jgi:hypothetical protein
MPYSKRAPRFNGTYRGSLNHEAGTTSAVVHTVREKALGKREGKSQGRYPQPVAGKAAFISAACKGKDCHNCYSLKCVCPHHTRGDK